MGFWEQLPYTNFHDLNLSELVKFVNATIARINEMSHSIEEQNQNIEDFKTYVMDYLNNLNVTQDVRDYIDELITNGTMRDIVDESNRLARVDWSNRVCVFLGDSYMTGWHADGTASPTYVETMCNLLNISSYYVYATGGVGFSYARGTHYIELFANFVSDHPDVIPTDVFIIGGYNDNTESRNDILNSVANPYNAEQTFNSIKNTFPGCLIHVAYIGRGAGVNTARSKIDAINKCAVTYQMACRMFGGEYIAKSELMLHNYKGLSSDGIHPNQQGHNAIGHYLADVLLYGYYQYEEVADWHKLDIEYSISGTSKTVIYPVSGTNWSIWENLTNEGVTIQTRTVLYNFTGTPISSMLMDGKKNTASICLGKICGSSACRNYICNFSDANEIAIPINVYVGYNDGSYKPLPTSANLLIDTDGTLSLVFTTMQNSYAYPTINNVCGFTLPALEFTIPLALC